MTNPINLARLERAARASKHRDEKRDRQLTPSHFVLYCPDSFDLCQRLSGRVPRQPTLALRYRIRALDERRKLTRLLLEISGKRNQPSRKVGIGGGLCHLEQRRCRLARMKMVGLHGIHCL